MIKMGIIIFGASGFLGGKLMAHCARAGKKVVGTYARNKKTGLVKFDLANPDLKSLWGESGKEDGKIATPSDFSHAVICGMMTPMDRCKTDPQRTYAVNVAGTKRLIDQLFDAGIIPIYISSDYVFEGTKGNYSEDDERRPVLAYGRHKKEVEDYLLASGRTGKNYAIVRPAKLYDVLEEDDQVILGLIRELEAGKHLRMATDQRFCATYVMDVCRSIELIVDRNITGCYNICSDEPVSRFGLATLVKEELGITTGEVEPCSLKELEFDDDRPLDTSMSNRKFKELTGFRFKALKDALRMIRSSREGKAASAIACESRDSAAASSCLLCGGALGRALDFGMQPVCNAFLSYEDEEESLYRLSVAQCGRCGLVQLKDRFPAEALKPTHKWITYAEPEEHLDGFADRIAGAVRNGLREAGGDKGVGSVCS